MKTVVMDGDPLRTPSRWRILDIETGEVEPCFFLDADDAYRAIPAGEALGQQVLARLVSDAIVRSGNFTR